MDAGANICITGDLDLLLGAKPIAPFSLSVATGVVHANVGQKVLNRNIFSNFTYFSTYTDRR